MIGLEVKEARVFVRPGATDMRKQINGLVVVIEQQMEANVFEPSLFLFCNGERRILKAVYWDRTGFCLWQKRLEKHRFPWPRDDEQARCEIDTEKLRMLLDGIDFWSAHRPLNYQHVS
jgi:transposase